MTDIQTIAGAQRRLVGIVKQEEGEAETDPSVPSWGSAAIRQVCRLIHPRLS
jgi:hypothetical protein